MNDEKVSSNYEPNRNEYYAFFDAFCLANPSLSKKERVEKVPVIWRKIKDDKELIREKMTEFKVKATQIKAKKLAVWTNFSVGTKRKTPAPESIPKTVEDPEKITEVKPEVKNETSTVSSDCE